MARNISWPGDIAPRNVFRVASQVILIGKMEDNSADENLAGEENMAQ